MVVLMSINTFAAIVGDSDGAAFVTKQEFESLKKNFADQIDNYNSSLDSKIDGAIASFLDGLDVSNKVTTQTGFDIEGGNDKKIIFLGRTNSGYNFANDIYTEDKIYVAAIGTYQERACFYEQDCYDNIVFHAVLNNGDTTNVYFKLNKDNTLEAIYKNATMKMQRLAFFYSMTHNSSGITWTKIKLFLNHPAALLADLVYNDDSLTELYGYGHHRNNNASTTDYPNDTGYYVWTTGSTPGGTTVINNPSVTLLTNMHPQHALYDDGRARGVGWLKNHSGIQINGTLVDDSGIHFCYQPTLALRATKNKWNDISIVKPLNEDRVPYTVTTDIKYQGGFWADWGRTITKELGIEGYGLKFDQLVNTSGDSTITPNNIYYKQLKKYWDNDLKYTGGFPVFKAEKDGILEFSLKSDKTKNVIFTTKQNTSAMPSASADFVRRFDYKLSTSNNYTTNVTNLNVTANTLYDYRIEIYKGETIYFNIDSADGNISVVQSGTAYWTA